MNTDLFEQELARARAQDAADPLADLRLTIDAQRTAHAALHRIAHEVCGGRCHQPSFADYVFSLR